MWIFFTAATACILQRNHKKVNSKTKKIWKITRFFEKNFLKSWWFLYLFICQYRYIYKYIFIYSAHIVHIQRTYSVHIAYSFYNIVFLKSWLERVVLWLSIFSKFLYPEVTWFCQNYSGLLVFSNFLENVLYGGAFVLL